MTGLFDNSVLSGCETENSTADDENMTRTTNDATKVSPDDRQTYIRFSEMTECIEEDPIELRNSTSINDSVVVFNIIENEKRRLLR